ncbi:class I ribonucleotide reductase maintenance protein YfaE [Pasteurella atlantica]|uniref:Class I ribonucleotide reductase maintenance protein YfaE n=3 Tax=Pasteurellaceae TaxID=712 RepID=A0AAW8CNJ9_9PAST|nr:class I ribonucleotide reductase maintenance protein YfaE [Pasteurella atlantica]MBR0574308.1 2Fe-2S ferredoxin-like protein [Pasteurella atlantica]MDP8032978.1 class I ribonucleotide reductase maintenance protein YfaE [Pasteurella atlantica]MDP8034865.1 class I ribonucleotide reductase maintenance protein YfaE [Pasteurella atlantica]MDP8036865.1 class I ribonucleotide reductase maintenance protein YfaE [Pasteurella atlantica]MDP8040212.1 class I ribonucleotide reductase maintenance protein
MQIRLIHSQVILEHNNKNSLLETLEKNGFFPEYQCRMGFCGSCRIKIKSGKVSYKQPPLAMLKSNEILTCCCVVEENLEIKF